MNNYKQGRIWQRRQMKRYKLKKDLPTFKAGGTFHINDKGNLVSDNEFSKGIVAYSKSTLDKFPSILTDWYEEYEERDPLAKISKIVARIDEIKNIQKARKTTGEE